jgi:hypothetical protein
MLKTLPERGTVGHSSIVGLVLPPIKESDLFQRRIVPPVTFLFYVSQTDPVIWCLKKNATLLTHANLSFQVGNYNQYNQ